MQNFILSLVLNGFCYLKDRNYLSLTLNSRSCTMKILLFLPATLLKFQFFLWHYYSANACSAFHKTYFLSNTLPSARCSPCTEKLPTTDAFAMLSLSYLPSLTFMTITSDTVLSYSFSDEDMGLSSKSFIKFSPVSPLYGEKRSLLGGQCL